ncbi:MAG: hypothetical protein AVDCRST_MAG67-2387, partial [uncultured Solirubrobacteraceae bacterium]
GADACLAGARAGAERPAGGHDRRCRQGDTAVGDAAWQGHAERRGDDLHVSVRHDHALRRHDACGRRRSRNHAKGRVRRRHGACAGDDLSRPARRAQSQRDGRGRRPHISHAPAAARPDAGRDPQSRPVPPSGRPRRHAHRHRQRQAPGRPAGEPVPVHAGLPARGQPAAHEPPGAVRVPAAVGPAHDAVPRRRPGPRGDRQPDRDPRGDSPRLDEHEQAARPQGRHRSLLRHGSAGAAGGAVRDPDAASRRLADDLRRHRARFARRRVALRQARPDPPRRPVPRVRLDRRRQLRVERWAHGEDQPDLL